MFLYCQILDLISNHFENFDIFMQKFISKPCCIVGIPFTSPRVIENDKSAKERQIQMEGNN